MAKVANEDAKEFELPYSPIRIVNLQRESFDEAWGLDCGQRGDQDGLFIREIIDRSPASVQGDLCVDDKIVWIDGDSIDGLEFSEAIERFGRAGLSVSIGVERPPAPPKVVVLVPRLEDYVFEIAPRLWAIRHTCPFESSIEPTSLSHLLFSRGTNHSKGVVRVWDLGDSGGHLKDALDCGSALYDDCGWEAHGRLPKLDFAVRLAAAVGAWLRRHPDNVALLCDSSGAKIRVGLAVVAILRIGGRLVGKHELDDSAIESYVRFLNAAGLHQPDMAPENIPPSFRRWLVNVDAAVRSRSKPNPDPLVIIGIEALSNSDLNAHLPDANFHVSDSTIATILQPAKTNTNRQLVAYSAVVIQDEFSVSLRSGRCHVAKFAHSSVFLAPGEPILPRSALDVLPNWGNLVPSDFKLLLRLAPSSTRTSTVLPDPKSADFLVPPTDDALLAMGNDALEFASAPVLV